MSPASARLEAGAGDGNRTHVTSLEGWGSTIELHPQRFRIPASAPWPGTNHFNRPISIGPSQSGHDLYIPPLYSAAYSLPFHPAPFFPSPGGGGRIRTYVDIHRQIYSLLPLTTRPPLRASRLRSAQWKGEYLEISCRLSTFKKTKEAASDTIFSEFPGGFSKAASGNDLQFQGRHTRTDYHEKQASKASPGGPRPPPPPGGEKGREKGGKGA